MISMLSITAPVYTISIGSLEITPVIIINELKGATCMNSFEEIQPFIPFLIPLLLLQAVLAITALVMLIQQDRVRYMNKLIWAIIILVFNLIGPILYFVLERRA